MSLPFDLEAALVRLATRNAGRSEADIQSEIRDVLLFGGFQLGEDEVRLEAPTGTGHRLDISIGGLIIECKRELRQAAAIDSGAVQLGGYLASKALTGGRYNGVLTDGSRWLLYRYSGGGAALVDKFTINPASVDARTFRWWLGSLLSAESGIAPTSANIEQRLGAGSAAFRIVREGLIELWREGAEQVALKLKRELWAKLLRSAFGSQFEDKDTLFVEHTYLVIMANAIAHAVIGFDLRSSEATPAVMLSGQRFDEAGFLGVGETGFFDWPLDLAGGAELVAEITRRAAAFDWVSVDHDVLKSLYQSVIAPEVRHRMGEYYTPDWLAARIVEHVVNEPIAQRVLDPACGSGTFLFHAVRRFLDAAEAAQLPVDEALDKVTNSVFGVDLHPVAVSLAQVTYMLALGSDRIAQRRGRLTIPVYLGDSMRWENAAESMLSSSGEVVVHTTDQQSLFESELRFPASVVSNSRFDEVVNLLSNRATDRPRRGSRPAVRGSLRNLGVGEEDLPTLELTYGVLCDLHDENRNHIWGFYVRNQARPAWLTQPSNRVECLVGNPPWLAYRYMAKGMQELFTTLSKDRGLWAGGARGRTTQQDLAGLFVARCVEQFLVGGGRFGFVMPRAALSRQTYKGFRAGDWSSPSEVNLIQFEQPWDLVDVEPEPFPVPGAVALGRRDGEARRALPTTAVCLEGHVGSFTVGERLIPQIDTSERLSPYAARFRAGANLFPRMLLMIVNRPFSPLGVAQGLRAVQSRKTSQDKVPWKALPVHTGVVESAFIRTAYLGESIAPFRVLDALEAVLPYDGTELMDGSSERLDRYPGVAEWWRGAESIWDANRRSDKRTLIQQLNYMRQLTVQFPIASLRVVYSASGNRLAATLIDDPRGVIEHKLYWGAVSTIEEGRYLCAVLNAPAFTRLVKPYQSVGAFGARDFDTYVWMPPTPNFDPTNSLHQKLVVLAERAENIAGTVPRSASGFKTDRGLIRDALDDAGLSTELDQAVATLLGLA